MRSYRVVGLAALTGLVAGALLTVLTFLVARYGPHADSWSFRGNGALVVPFGLGPAVLAAGWTMIAAHARPPRRWFKLGIAAGLLGIALVLINSAALPLGGTALDHSVGAAALLLLLAWTVAAPLLAAFFPRAAPLGPGTGSHLIAGAALPIAMALGFYALTAVVPPGS